MIRSRLVCVAHAVLLCGMLTLSSAVEASVNSISIEVDVEQINGQNPCYGFKAWMTGASLTSVSVKPPTGTTYSMTPDGIDAWVYEDGCFASVAALQLKYPNGSYLFTFGGAVPDSETVSYAGPNPPLPCFPAITAPAHLSTTSATPTLQWNVGCSVASEHCHYQVEEKDSETPVLSQYATDCPGSNAVSVPNGLLQSGVAYNFWVELDADDNPGTPGSTNGGDPYTYYQATQTSNEVWFPEPSRALMLAVGAPAVFLASRRRRRSRATSITSSSTCRRRPESRRP